MTSAAVWRKSSRSTQGTSGECVEVARFCEAAAPRDFAAPDSGDLSASREASPSA